MYAHLPPSQSVALQDLNVRSRYRALETTEEVIFRLRRDQTRCAIFPSWADIALWRLLHRSCKVCGGTRRGIPSNVLICSRIPRPRYDSSCRAHSLHDSIQGLLRARKGGIVHECSQGSRAVLLHSADRFARPNRSVCARGRRIGINLRGIVALRRSCRRRHKHIVVQRGSRAAPARAGTEPVEMQCVFSITTVANAASLL